MHYDEEQKAAMREKHRQAYLLTKERQKNNPAVKAIKDKQKEMRRAAYQKQKEKQSTLNKKRRAEKKLSEEIKKAEARALRDRLLIESLKMGRDLIQDNREGDHNNE